MGIASLLYLIVARPKGEINDLGINGDFAYLANGLGGLRVVGLQDPGSLIEAGFFRCSGPFSKTDDRIFNFLDCATRANGLAIQDSRIFLTDQRSGLWVFDILTDPAKPNKLAQLRLPGRPQGVVVLSDFAYVAAGRAGIRIVKIKVGDPKPDFSGIAQRELDLSDLDYKALQDVGNATAIFSDNINLFWIERDNILHVLNLENKSQPKEIFTQEFEYPLNDFAFFEEFALVAAGKQGLVVLNKSNPEQITTVAQLPLGGTANGVFIQGNNAYITVEGVGLTVVDITHIETPRIIPNPWRIHGNPAQIIVEGRIAYVANGSNGLLAIETGVMVETKQLGQSGAPVTALNVDKSGNYAYLASGERGLRVLDVTDPTRPNEVAFLDTAGEAISVAIAGDTAFIADGLNGLVIADVSNRSGALQNYKQISSKDARDVAVSNSFAYVADNEQVLIIVDATAPFDPKVVKIMEQPSGDLIHPQGVSVLADYAYLANGDHGVAVVNVLDKNIPTIVQQIITPGQADARSVAVIAYTPPDQQISGVDPFNADPRNPATAIYAFVANGGYGLQLLDISDPLHKLAVQIPLDNAIQTIPGAAMDVSISRDRAYVAYDRGGVAILNTSNPAAPQLVGFVTLAQTENRAVGLFADGSKIYLAALNYGLQIIDAANTSLPTVIGKYSAPASVQNMAVQGNFAYTVDGVQGLWVFDISDPNLPQEISFVPIQEANGVFVDNEHAYIAAGSTGLRIVDISDPRKPFIIGGLDTLGTAQSIVVANRPDLDPPGTYAYICDASNGLVIVNVTNPQNPMPAGSLNQIGNAFRLTENGRNYIYIAALQDGLAAVNVIDPANPSLGDREQTGQTTRGVAVIENQYAYAATGENGLVIFDATYPLAVSPLEYNDASSGEWLENVSISFTNSIDGTITSTVTTAPTFAFLAERASGMRILDTTDPRAPQPSGFWEAKYSSPVAETVPVPPDVLQIVAEWIPPEIQGDDPGRFRMFVADSLHGFSIVDGTKNSKFKLLDIFETKGTPAVAALLDYVMAKSQGTQYPSIKVSLAVQQVFLDFALFGVVGFFCWIGFFALFVLPPSRFSDWENLYNRLLFYLFGRHGTAARVRNGKLVSRPDELEQAGPGIFLVDASSAIILEKRGIQGSRAEALPLVRVASSKVVYSGNRIYLTRPGFDEILRGAADLRPQVRLATGVNGYTRDGIEVETLIFTIFTLGEPAEVVRVVYIPPQTPLEGQEVQAPYQPQAKDLQVVNFRRNQKGDWQALSVTNELDEEDKREIHQFLLTDPALHALTNQDELMIRQPNSNGAPFEVDPVRIFQAIFAQADDLPENKQLEWTDLPSLVAIERFRNVIAGEAYDNLYNPIGRQEDYPIRDLKLNLRNWTRNQGILSYQFVRKVNSQPITVGEIIPEASLLASMVQPLNNPKILRVRGIKVKFAGFGELNPTDPEVRKQFFDVWQASREMDADFTLGNYELRALRQRNEWRIEAQQEILNELVEILDANPHASDALAMHVLQSLEGAASDPDTSLLLPEDTINMLRNLRNWFGRS